MIDRLQSVLRGEARVAYALLFGSAAKGRLHAHSDLDVAVASAGHRFTTREIGDLTARLESAAGRAVHLVLLDEAPPGLAYRIFRDGLPLMVSDERAMKDRLARVILEYFDFRPVEEMLTRGALRAGHGR